MYKSIYKIQQTYCEIGKKIHELVQNWKWVGLMAWADEKVKENGKDND